MESTHACATCSWLLQKPGGLNPPVEGKIMIKIEKKLLLFFILSIVATPHTNLFSVRVIRVIPKPPTEIQKLKATIEKLKQENSQLRTQLESKGETVKAPATSKEEFTKIGDMIDGLQKHITELHKEDDAKEETIRELKDKLRKQQHTK